MRSSTSAKVRSSSSGSGALPLTAVAGRLSGSSAASSCGAQPSRAIAKAREVRRDKCGMRTNSC
ncbi:hypothetical protein D3C78_1812820 [compost metagenome]